MTNPKDIIAKLDELVARRNRQLAEARKIIGQHYHLDADAFLQDSSTLCLQAARILFDHHDAIRSAFAVTENIDSRFERLLAWIKDAKRKPPELAFTSGPERQIAEAIRSALEAVEKLPKTADGAFIVPGMLLWSTTGTDPHRAYMNWTRTREDQPWKKTAWAFGYSYSTRSAALAAAQAKPEGGKP